jgi:ribosomal protein S27E
MLARAEHREEVLAVLQYLAQRDLMIGVRERAREVLDAGKQSATPAPASTFLNPDDARYMLGVRCEKCQHVTYFDRRRLCSEKHMIKRLPPSPSDSSDEMELRCGKCGHLMVKHVDCKGL